MILALLLVAMQPQSAVDAERAFAAAAQTDGQWTAFRRFAHPEGVMFVPQQVNAQEWLEGRADPASAVMWWPAEVHVSCDGGTAVTTGPWVRDGGKRFGYFTTVWIRDDDGAWRWLLDHGDELATPRMAGEEPRVRKASCRGAPPSPAALPVNPNWAQDLTLSWDWHVAPNGSRQVKVMAWTGSGYTEILRDEVAAQ